MNKKIKSFLAYTNPVTVVVGFGVFFGCFLHSVFSGTIKNVKKVVESESEE